MSVVNKMLNDLDARAASGDDDGADYQEPAENKRIRYMIAFIAFVVLSAAGYFTYRAMGPAYFQNLYVQTIQLINGEEPVKEQKKQVSVNRALDQMMPTRNSPSEQVNLKEEEADQPEILDQVPPEQTATETDNATSEPLLANSNQLDANDTVESSTDDTNTTEVANESAEPLLQEPLPENMLENMPEELIPLPQQDMSFVRFSDENEMLSEIAELNSKAAEAVSQNDVSQAVRLYRQILIIDEHSHDIRKKLAVLHYSNNETGAASVVLNEGIEIEPERADFRLMLARLFYRQKQLKQAYAVLAEIEPDVQRNIDFYGLKATVAQELEFNAESSHLYGRLVIFEPNRAQWWLGLAISLDRLGQKEGALRAYENAADLRQLSASADDFIRQRILELGG